MKLSEKKFIKKLIKKEQAKSKFTYSLSPNSFSDEDFDYAQNHLGILSGLYGLLKPLDLMQAYRLEMGTNLKINRKKKKQLIL